MFLYLEALARLTSATALLEVYCSLATYLAV